VGIGWEDIILGFKRTTRQFLQDILEHITESFVVTDLQGKIVFFNKGSERLFLYRPEEVVGRHIVMLGAPRPNVLQEIRKGNTFRGEISLMRKTGERFPAHVVCVPLRDEGGKPMGMMGVARDLTDEREKENAEKEIMRLKSFYENLIASLNDGVLIIDRDGRISYANNRFEEITGYGKAEIVGRHYKHLVAKEALEHFTREIYGETDDSGKNRKTFESTFLTKDKKRIPVLVSSSPLTEGNKKGIIIVITDVTEINALKKELFQSEKMTLLGKLAGEIAHEINNPLGGLIIATQMLIDDLEKRPVSRRKLLKELREIEREASRCRMFIARVLNFARMIPEDKTKVNVHDMIEDALLLVQRQCKLEGIDLIKDFWDGDIFVTGNTSNLQQVVINLVNNAREAILPSAGLIIIKTYLRNDDCKQWACIEINDSGKGIPPEIMDRIFDPFFTTKPNGTGLGLSVSKRIVEEHGGRIIVRSLLGKGSSFVINLPYGDQ
jgi:PAS domain S-box-containing protein